MQIPIYKRQVATPHPSHTYPRVPAGLERETRAKERGFGFFGKIASKLVGDIFKVESDTQYNRAVTETQKATNEFLMQLEDSQLTVKPSEGLGIDEIKLENPDFMGFTQRYKEFSEQAKEAALDKITMPGLKKVVGSKLDSMFAGADIKVQEIQRRKVLENGRAELNKDVEYYVKETRSIDDLVRRVNGAADLEYISHDDAEKMIQANTKIINTSNALDDAMAISRQSGIDAATSMLLTDEAGEKYSLTYDERVSVASRARTAWGLEVGAEAQQDKETGLTSYWEAYKNIHAAQPTLVDMYELDNIERYPSLSVEQKKSLHKEMEARAKEGLEDGPKPEKSVNEITGQDYRNMYADKFAQLSKGELTVERFRDWLIDNKGPGPDGEPRIGNKDFMAWWEKAEKIKDDPPHLAIVLAGIAETYDAEIKELDDAEKDYPEKRGKLVEEKLSTIERIREDVIENKYDARETAAIRKEIEDPVKAETGNLWARRFLQSTFLLRGTVRPPEEQMVEWAQEGRLDERGRLIGKTDAEQLKLMGMDSFDQLKWKGQLKKQYEATGQSIENISTSDPNAKPAFTYVLDDRGQRLMIRNAAGIIMVKVIIDGETKWIKTSELP